MEGNIWQNSAAHLMVEGSGRQEQNTPFLSMPPASDLLPLIRSHPLKFPLHIPVAHEPPSIDEVSALMVQSLPKVPTSEYCCTRGPSLQHTNLWKTFQIQAITTTKDERRINFQPSGRREDNLTVLFKGNNNHLHVYMQPEVLKAEPPYPTGLAPRVLVYRPYLLLLGDPP
jgi:hypothetical protein